MSPGATMQDALAAGTLDGFCNSIEAYERRYTPGEEHSGPAGERVARQLPPLG
jgi:hypothetical protein